MAERILVTGGLGYIGSHTVVELQQSGYDVIIVDNLSNSRIEVLEGIKGITGREAYFINADVGDRAAMQEVFSAHDDISGIIHFAAYKAVGESVEKPLMYYKNNIGGLINLLDEMRGGSVRNFVFSSSCTVYGDTKDSPITEDSPIAVPNSPYGNTKKISEEILRDVCDESELDVISLRYFNPVGAHDTALIGELPLGVPNNLVPYITQTAAGIRKELTIFGNDYDTPDGTCIRDYIHVVDLARAHVKALEWVTGKSHDGRFNVFNVGTGKGSSVLEVVRTFEEVTGITLPYRMGDRRPGDVEQIWASTDRANRELDWAAERDLRNMMETSWNWQKHISELS